MVVGEECPTAVHLGDLFDERCQVRGGVEHEDVDSDVVSRALVDLFESQVDRLVRGRIVELGAPERVDVCGWLAIGDHQDLLGAGFSCEHLARELEAVLHIRPVHVVPRQFGEVASWHFSGHFAEGNDAQIVLRVLSRNERFESECDLLCRNEVVSHGHRQAEVEHQHRRCARRPFGALDLEVVGR